MLDNERLKKLFYYCLKRTGNREYAEDLSGDISLEILTMLNRGYKPENFNAWMWTVAKAKYARWVKNKQISSYAIANWDISDYTDISSGENIENNIVREEEIHLLRRELALMSREYREITVAYYIENKKISDISKAVNLPEGTIKRKLSESRKYLKEGISMTRTYGKRSYSPENINFHCNRINPQDNVPDSLFSSKLSKNILLEAYINPCSTEELSISLGVAAPYLEEELDKLVEGLLLAKTKDNKYETDFIILERTTQKKIFDKTLETADKICEKLLYFAGANADLPILIDTMDILYFKEQQNILMEKYNLNDFLDENSNKTISFTDEQREMIQSEIKKCIQIWKNKFGNKSTGGIISQDMSLWFYVFKQIRDIIYITGMNKGISMEYSKKYKGEWSITGFEDYTDHELLKYTVGIDWDNNAERMDRHLFKFYFNGLSRTKPTLEDCDLLGDILKNEKKFSSLSDNEKNIIKGLVKNEFAVIEDDNIKPTFPVIFTSGLEEFDKCIIEADLSEELKNIAKSAVLGADIITKVCYEEIFNLYEYNLEQIKTGLPERLGEQAKFCARDMLHYLHNAVLKYATERNYLPLTDKPVGIGLYVVN